MKNIAIASLSILLGFAASATPQSFSSGSTGADGALDLAAMSCTECWVQLPPSGVLNYTTVNIPAGKTLKFRKNALNTPVFMLAQGDVAIAGAVHVGSGGTNSHGDQDPSLPGPGGFPGGGAGLPGLGPGGGTVGDPNGRWVGPLSLVPLVGGSGGGNKACGGGGAILIASSQNISVAGSIMARSDSWSSWNWWAGSGGAIRLVANSIGVAGVLGAESWYDQGGFAHAANPGVIRLEAPLDALSFTGSANPAPVISTINPTLFASATPSLTIVSVGGYSVPGYAGSRMDAADLVLPNQLTDPINIVVNASNIPIGTQIDIIFGGGTGTSTPGVLSGSFASSSATGTVSGLTRTGLTYLYAQAVFAPSGGGGGGGGGENPPGPDHVAQVRVTAPPGGRPAYAFLRSNGTEIPAGLLSRAFLEQYR
jgi:hypothetical protein